MKSTPSGNRRRVTKPAPRARGARDRRSAAPSPVVAPDTVPPPSGVRERQWTPRYQQSGTLPGESVGAAIRRYVAWIVLAREQLDHGGDRSQAHRDLTGCAETLATLSLEVDALEGEREATSPSPLLDELPEVFDFDDASLVRAMGLLTVAIDADTGADAAMQEARRLIAITRESITLEVRGRLESAGLIAAKAVAS